MEDETLGFFKKTSSSHARLNVPALVQVAALAIIMIRGLDVLMIFNTLGVRGIGEFIHRSVQLELNAGLFKQSGAGFYRDLVCVFTGERASLGALAIMAKIRTHEYNRSMDVIS
ncbi:YbjO family protein [Escherichia coli]|uniref:YbjO family protein n=1 Tax=Escherichia coli TaxID=562 RepID=UPI00202374BE|nr:YbjO family protein [Escherichia coli]